MQDLLHVALRSITDDVRAEEPAPSFAGSGSQCDFYLPAISTMVETKHIRDPRHGRQGVVDEIIADSVRHGLHPGCDRLICLLFDPERHIPNVRALEDMVTVKDHPSVEVYVIRGLVGPLGAGK